MQGKIGPLISIPTGPAMELPFSYDRNHFLLVLIEFFGTVDRICCSAYIPPAKVHSVFRLRGLFYDISPQNLIYSAYPMAALKVCGYLAARAGGGSDGLCLCLWKNGRTACFRAYFQSYMNSNKKSFQQTCSRIELRDQ